MNLTTPETRDFARRLLATEAAAGSTTYAKAAAMVRVCEKLRRSLSVLAGVEGFRSLLSRALVLGKAECPALATASVNRDGSLEGLDGVASVNGASSAVRERAGEDAVLEGGVVLIAQLLGLLFLFIGEGLTLTLMEDLWPQAGFGGTGSRKEAQDEPKR